jgi:Glycosyltransferases involved in cell wall biogenesis
MQDTQIKCTIVVTAYNLGKYIAQTLDSLLVQKTSFNYQVLVIDDASTDNTTQILKDYEKRFPEKVRVIYNKENKGYLASSNICFDQVKTPYFSFIDADDYWLTTYRLQKAVDFLESHPDYSMYGGNTYYLSGKNFESLLIGEEYLDKTYAWEDYIKGVCPFVHTSAIVLRNCVYNKGVPKIYHDNEHTILNCAFRGESIRFIEHLRKGKLFLSKEVLSAYRIHSGGIWSGASEFKRNVWNLTSRLTYMHLFPDGSDFFYQTAESSFNYLMKFNNSINDWKRISSRYEKPRGLYKIYYKIWRHLGKKLKKKGIL